jgi:hypothetical protein
MVCVVKTDSSYPFRSYFTKFYSERSEVSGFFWIRPINFFNTVLPVHLLHYLFDLNNLVLGSMVTMPGAIGILVFVFSLIYFFENTRGKGKTFLLYVPSLLLILVFSNQAVPALHGLQGPIALLLLVGVMQMRKILNTTWIAILLSLQVIINALLLSRFFYKLV